MKNLFVAVLVIGLLMVPSIARAEQWYDNFDGNSNMTWSSPVWDGGSNAGLNSADDVLNYTISTFNPTSGGDNFAAKGSGFTVDFTKDFAFKAWINNTVSTGSEWAGTSFGLVHMVGDAPDIMVMADAAYDNYNGNWKSKFNVSVEDNDHEGADQAWERSADIDRSVNSAWAGLRYTASTDYLEIGIFDNESLSGGPIVGMDYTAFNANVNPGAMNVVMAGSSGNLPISNGQMTFDNFSGSVAPEPISSALFLLGGAVLGIKRLKKKSV